MADLFARCLSSSTGTYTSKFHIWPATAPCAACGKEEGMVAGTRQTDRGSTRPSHFRLLTLLSCSASERDPASFPDDTIARFFPLECGTRGKHFFPDSIPGVCHSCLLSAHTPSWTPKWTGLLPHFQMKPSHVLSLGGEREENFQPLISRIFILPYTSSHEDNDRLQNLVLFKTFSLCDVKKKSNLLLKGSSCFLLGSSTFD